jgi:hypothetical protein
LEPLFFMALGYAGFLLFQEVQTRRRAGTASSEEVCGHTVLHHRAYTHSGFRATRNVELEQNVTTIQGMLPDWVHFGWPVERRGDGAPRDANALWIEIILGPAPALLEGGTVVAANGNMTFETRPAAFPPSSRGLVEAARPFLERKPDVVAELIRYVDAGLSPSNAVAFRILSRSCPDKRPARDLARRHRDHADPGLAAAIAELEYPRGRERLVAIVNGTAPEDAKKIALRVLIHRYDRALLAQIDPAAVPGAVAGEYLEAIGRTKRPEAERAALHFVEDDVMRKTALDVLAAVGGRASIERLLALQSSGFDRDEALGLTTTIEVVRSRIAQDGGARGTLSLADGGSDAGAVSFTHDGGLALADPDEP